MPTGTPAELSIGRVGAKGREVYHLMKRSGKEAEHSWVCYEDPRFSMQLSCFLELYSSFPTLSTPYSDAEATLRIL